MKERSAGSSHCGLRNWQDVRCSAPLVPSTTQGRPRVRTRLGGDGHCCCARGAPSRTSPSRRAGSRGSSSSRNRGPRPWRACTTRPGRCRGQWRPSARPRSRGRGGRWRPGRRTAATRICLALLSGAIFSRNSRTLRVALVAVLGPAEVAAVGLGALEERHEVRHAHLRHRGLELVAEADGGDEGHVPAVAAPGGHDARGVEARLRRDPVEQRAQVLVGVLALRWRCRGRGRSCRSRRSRGRWGRGWRRRAR